MRAGCAGREHKGGLLNVDFNSWVYFQWHGLVLKKSEAQIRRQLLATIQRSEDRIDALDAKKKKEVA